jgi:polyisoprenoid-binding protein YceI
MMTSKVCVRVYVAAAAVVIGLSATAQAQGTLRVIGGQIAVVCPLTVGGSFEAKTKNLTGDLAVDESNPQAVKGTIAVDLLSLETGIGLRDKHLKSNYLEVDKGPQYSEARLHDIRVDRLEGKTPFRGVLTLHGQQKEVTGTAQIRPEGGGYRMEATFPVKIADFQIPDPTYLGVGVADEVVVRVNLNAAPVNGASGRK